VESEGLISLSPCWCPSIVPEHGTHCGATIGRRVVIIVPNKSYHHVQCLLTSSALLQRRLEVMQSAVDLKAAKSKAKRVKRKVPSACSLEMNTLFALYIYTASLASKA
jgi:hypothetical protein